MSWEPTMKRMTPLAPLAALLTLIFAGLVLASGHSSLSSRVGRSDAEKLSSVRSDSQNWLAEKGHHEWEREHYRELREMAWHAGASLDVDGGMNGGASVTGWSRDSIRVVARVQAEARTEDRARELVRGIRIVYQNGKLSAEGPETEDKESWAVNFDILAPRTKTLRLDAENGPVCVADMESKMELGTVNGPVVLSAVAGDVRAHTENGPLTVSLTGTKWRGAGLDASTVNGPVMLAVPKGYNCMLETGTVNGPMQMNIELTVQGRIGGHPRISAQMGSGGPRVRAITTNGPAFVSYRDPRDLDDEVEN
jgi:hypothetical protein